jgi:hypothetical protein
MPDPVSTWGIPPAVRRILKARILELRSLLEEDARRQLAAIGITGSEIREPPGGRGLSTEDVRAREVIIAVIATAQVAGEGIVQAIASYVSETAFTFLDRMVAFRSLEERALLLVDDQPETLVRLEPERGTSSLIWRVRAETPGAAPRDVARAAYRRACDAISERVHVLFDRDDEHSVLFPLTATWDQILAAFNDPAVPAVTYEEDEILGWVYQYWNSTAKDNTYAKLGRGGKIEEPEELSAASTLYTERYIVDYLLQNTLGALWVEMHPTTTLPASWPYYVHPPGGNIPVHRQPKSVREITLIDPCVGSGHFLVRAFELFIQLYNEEGIEDPADVPTLILERNLFGVDIDRRAAQIAALALYVKGCVASGPNFRPRTLNLVSCDIALPSVPPVGLLDQFVETELKDLVRSVWDGLAGAPMFGSLLHPERAVNEALSKIRAHERGTLWEKDDGEWAKRRRHLVSELRRTFNHEAGATALGRHLFGTEASRGLDLLQILGRQYDVIVTNPPYAGSGNLGPQLRRFVQETYPTGRRDLSAAFVLRCREFADAGSFVGMVTQQGWLFLSSFSELRDKMLSEDQIKTLLHLGSGAFEEISGVIVSVVCVTLKPWSRSENNESWIVSTRATDIRSPAAKAAASRMADAPDGTRRFVTRQDRFLAIEGSPIAYWASDGVLLQLGRRPQVSDILIVREGLHPSDSERFVHMFWEHPTPGTGWSRFAKGGGYARWCGLEHFVVDWEDSGRRIKETGRAIIPSEDMYFARGLTYSSIGQGVFAARDLRHSVFADKGPAVFAKSDSQRLLAASVLNGRVFTYFVRTLNPSITFNKGYVEKAPYREPSGTAIAVARACFGLKRLVLSSDPLQPDLIDLGPPGAGRETGAAQALLHSLEGLNERLVFDAFGLDPLDASAVLDETGTPSGWYPLVMEYDTIPTAPAGVQIPVELTGYVATLERRTLSATELAGLKARLQLLYQAGPGATTDDHESLVSDPDRESDAESAGRLVLPTETFLEELSQKLEVHPISVYWLLDELRNRNGLVSPPVAKLEFEDYVSVMVLRLLGYRWPGQDAHEVENGPLLDSEVVDRDGIIPLLTSGDEPIAQMRIRDVLQHRFGDNGAETFLRDFRRYVGRDLDDWLRRDFFKRHAQQFKSRPIAWHLRSRAGAFEAFVLCHRMSRETLVKLRVEHAGRRVARLKGEAKRAKEQGQEGLASDLQFQIEDVEAFRQQLEGIERGAELRDRIRCRWKDETADGRPGPYSPDINDGVKVNIRPFQENGLLAATAIKKW